MRPLPVPRYTSYVTAPALACQTRSTCLPVCTAVKPVGFGVSVNVDVGVGRGVGSRVGFAVGFGLGFAVGVGADRGVGLLVGPDDELASGLEDGAVDPGVGDGAWLIAGPDAAATPVGSPAAEPPPPKQVPARNEAPTTTRRAMPMPSSRSRRDRSTHQGLVWLLISAHSLNARQEHPAGSHHHSLVGRDEHSRVPPSATGCIQEHRRSRSRELHTAAQRCRPTCPSQDAAADELVRLRRARAVRAPRDQADRGPWLLPENGCRALGWAADDGQMRGRGVGDRSLRRNGDDREHACLEVARDVAHEEIGAGLGQIDGSRLRAPGIDVVAVADELDARAVFDDVAVLVDREPKAGGRS